MLEKVYSDQTKKVVAIFEVALINDVLFGETVFILGDNHIGCASLAPKVDMTQPLKCRCLEDGSLETLKAKHTKAFSLP